MLCWFDERPGLLADVVASWAPVVDVVVAVDGPFAEYPTSLRRSPPEQLVALRRACAESGMALRSWVLPGRSQVQKRSFALEVARWSCPDGWLLSLDSDEALDPRTDAVAVRSLLERTSVDVGEVWTQAPDEVRQRRAFRASTRPRVEGLHWRVLAQDGRRLWDHEDLGLAPSVELPLWIDHRRDWSLEAPVWRSVERLEASYAYYRDRVEH